MKKMLHFSNYQGEMQIKTNVISQSDTGIHHREEEYPLLVPMQGEKVFHSLLVEKNTGPAFLEKMWIFQKNLEII